jgi:hypothetical protein
MDERNSTLAALGNVSIPVNDILTLVPGIGFILKAMLRALPSGKVTFSLGQTDAPLDNFGRVSG